MSEGVLIASIPSLITLVGVIITNLFTNSSSNRKRAKENAEVINNIKLENTKVINEFRLEVTKNQAITDTKIEELTREVREHNNFAKRMPVVENDIKHIEDRITELHKDN
jgi:hypothetical protein